jgi:hypothetical protein
MANSPIPLDSFWGNSAAKNAGFTQSPQTLISSALPNAYIIASVLLIIYLLYAGFQYISSQGEQEKIAKSKAMITNAAIGFLIIFSSYWIIQGIQIITGIPIISGIK